MSIKVDLKIFLFGIVFFITHQIKIYAILMIFAFIHELAHLCTGLILGYKIKSIGVNPFGFQILFKSYVPNNGNIKIVIALSGPLINFLISLICFYIKIDFYILKEQIIYANILLGVFNLLPIYPLDGGRILKEIVFIKKGRRKTYQILSKISKITVILLTVICSILILYVHNIVLVLVLGYLWYLVLKNEKNFILKEKIYCKIQEKV